MDRVNVYTYPAEDDYGTGRMLAGWFDMAKAERWSDSDGNGNGSGGVGRGQAVIRTSQGRWVLQRWTNWQNEASQHEFITDDQARDWLLREHEDEAIAQYFGEIEEERGPGRPAIGEAVNVRVGSLLGPLDAHAKARGTTRAQMIRRYISEGLVREGVVTQDEAIMSWAGV